MAMDENQMLNMPDLLNDIRQLINESRSKIARSVNSLIVIAYWKIGERIVLEEQKGSATASYGERLIETLASNLTREFGNGFSATNLMYFRQFYLKFQIPHAVREEFPGQILHAVSEELSWTHYRLLLKVKDPDAVEFYLREAVAQDWSTRALERQINSLYYDRLLSSGDKKPVLHEAGRATSSMKDTPAALIKNPYVFEFLGLPADGANIEKDVENALIANLSNFLIELGKGFAFVARQKHVRTDTKDFFIDLVFYNYILKCFVLIDLKIGELTHQDIGQMDLYVRLYEDKFRSETDNPTVGIILCTEKDETIVKYSVLSESRQLFASKYLLYLPTEEELKELLRHERSLWEQLQKEKQHGE